MKATDLWIVICHRKQHVVFSKLPKTSKLLQHNSHLNGKSQALKPNFRNQHCIWTQQCKSQCIRCRNTA